MSRASTASTLAPELEQTTAASTPSLLVGRIEAARLCGVSTPTWDRMASSGKTPSSIRLGGRVLWRREDLEDWTRLGCPDRKTFHNAH